MDCSHRSVESTVCMPWKPEKPKKPEKAGSLRTARRKEIDCFVLCKLRFTMFCRVFLEIDLRWLVVLLPNKERTPEASGWFAFPSCGKAPILMFWCAKVCTNPVQSCTRIPIPLCLPYSSALGRLLQSMSSGSFIPCNPGN